MEKNTNTAKSEWVIIPCGGAKANEATTAADLYTGKMFKAALATARTITDDSHIVILSALHGLLELDEVVAPYNVKMGDADSIAWNEVAAQMISLGMVSDNDDLYSMLPKAYRSLLDDAARALGTYAVDVYEANAGIGEQNGICSQIRRNEEITLS